MQKNDDLNLVLVSSHNPSWLRDSNFQPLISNIKTTKKFAKIRLSHPIRKTILKTFQSLLQAKTYANKNELFLLPYEAYNMLFVVAKLLLWMLHNTNEDVNLRNVFQILLSHQT